MINMQAMGRLTKDPVQKETKNGKLYTIFNVAVNESKDEVHFINCMFFFQSDTIMKYFKKGDVIMVEGKPDINIYDGKGNFTLLVDKFYFVPGNKGVENDENNNK